MIELLNLTKRYGKTVAIDDVSLSIEAGAVVGIVGKAGAGKSTLLRLCAGLEKPSSGDATVQGASITAQPEQVRARIGYLPAEPGIYPDLTCAEYLAFFAQCHGVPKQQHDTLVGDLLQLVDLHHRRDIATEMLTPGMRKRLGVARAMVHDPQVLLLDDLTTWLDPRARVDTRDLLADLSGMGKTILISCNNQADIRDVCTNIIALNAGQISDVSGSLSEDTQAARRQIVVKYLGDVDVADGLARAGKNVLTVTQMQGPLPPDAQQTPLTQLKEMRVIFCGDYSNASELLRSLMHSSVQIVTFSEEAYP
jgi:ABC-2 type transport system ATP-binding protein